MTQSKQSLNRRSFNLFCGSAGVAATLGVTLPESPELQSFLGLSSELTGFPTSALAPQLAARLLQGLIATGHGEALQGRLRGHDGDFADLETEIVAAWYSGVLPSRRGPVVGTLQGALIWDALGFASPPGNCVSPEEWSKPPPATA